MPNLFLTLTFQRNFEKLDPKVQGRIKKALVSLKEDMSAGKQLSGDLKGEFSLRVGDYRIIYSFEQDIIFLETVRHRKRCL